MISDAEHLAIQLRTGLALNPAGRIVHVNDPDRSRGPLFLLSGSATGNVVAVHADVADGVAAEIARLASTEPPFFAPDSIPRYRDRYVALLSQTARVAKQDLGMRFELPKPTAFEGTATLIDSESEEGVRLAARLGRDGMPDELVAMGFHDIGEFWPPWCVALHAGSIASVAFAARISASGAEAGVATVPSLRGKGYAAAATAGWAGMSALKSRALFYSTDRTNISSQKVTARLGLRYLGASLRIA